MGWISRCLAPEATDQGCPAVLEPMESRVFLSVTPYHLTFSDEFNSLQMATGAGTAGWLPRDHWNNAWLPDNAEKQYYVNPATDGYGQHRINNGVLTLRAQPTPAGFDAKGQPYVSAAITTAKGAPYAGNPQGTGFLQKYGYFETRAKLPAGKGLWPAFWLLPSNGAWPPEYDIFEVLGHDTDTIHHTAHWNDGGHKMRGFGATQMIDSADGFHTYGFLWTPTEIKWYVDGKPTFASENRYNSPMYMLLNLAVGGHWPGNPDASTSFPADMQIDYVRVYSNDSTVPAVGGQPGYSPSAHLPIPLAGQTQPAQQTIESTESTYVRAGTYANSNFGSATQLGIKYAGSTSNDTRETYIKFNLSGASPVGKAMLQLYMAPGTSNSTVIGVGAYGSTNTTWSESTLTWNNKPATTTSILNNFGVGRQTVGQWAEWDVTSFLKAQQAAGATSVTLVLKGVASTTAVASPESDDAAAGTRPRLIITAGTAASGYQESFANSTAGHTSLGGAGWKAHHSTNATAYATGSTDSTTAPIVSNAAGSDSAGGFLYHGNVQRYRPHIWWTEEQGFGDISALQTISFALRNSASAASSPPEDLRVAIRIGTTWYASQQTFNNADVATWQSKTLTRSGASFYRLNFTPGSSLPNTLPSTTTALPASGAVTAIGFYDNNLVSNVRIDSVAVNGGSTTTAAAPTAPATQTLQTSFDNTTGANASLAPTSWQSHYGTGGAAYVSTTSNASAAPIVASTTGADGTAGHLQHGNVNRYKPQIWWTDRSFGDVGKLRSIAFSTRNSDVTEGLRVAVRVGTSWYVSNATFNNASNTAWARHTLSLAGATFSPLNFTPGSRLPGEGNVPTGSVSLPTTGTVTAIGFYDVKMNNVIRIDQVSVTRAV